MKKWQLAEPVPQEAFTTLSAYPRLLASLLWRRGIRTPEEAERYLNPDWARDVHDPFLFNDMRKAVARILAARDAGERVVIHGDYDADGVSGSVILHTTLRNLGIDASVHLPHREKDGYGMSEATINKLSSENCKLIITCDCGISNGKEIGLALAKGIDTIIADHHTLPAELPPAHAILHPLRDGENYPFRHLTGGGVAFKLCQALWKAANLPEGQDKWLLDMVSISTVADMGALTGENRALVHYGLTVLAKTKRMGLARLVEMSGAATRGLDSGTIGFQIAPRINAAGRMDHADGAFALLTAETKDDAVRHAEILDRHNNDRRAATETIIAEARKMAAAQKDDAAIVVAGDGWPAALAGLVAARLVDDHYRPVIALGRTEDGRYVGSGRSIPDFDVTAALHRVSKHILKFGGHPRACGLTIEGDKNFNNFRDAFKADASVMLKDAELIPRVEIEESLSLAEANLATVESIRKLEPHGEGNPKPKFLITGAKVAYADLVGKEGKHLRMTVVDGPHRLKLIAFGMGTRPDVPQPGASADFIVELDVNEWQGTRTPQGRVIDFRVS